MFIFSLQNVTTSLLPLVPEIDLDNGVDRELQLSSNEMGNSLSYKKIRRNRYISSDWYGLKKKTPICNCLSDSKCDTECLNRSLFYECDRKSCPCGDECTNTTIQTAIKAPVEVFFTVDKGWGVRAQSEIKSGSFIIEYIGEVMSESEYIQRINTRYSEDVHDYCIYLEAGIVIDAREMGNESRFFNHSCDANCDVQKWQIKGKFIQIFRTIYIS